MQRFIPTIFVIIRLLLFTCFITLGLAETAGQVEYVGGTLDHLRSGEDGLLRTASPEALLIQLGKWDTQVPYDRVNLLEYGQNASRRVVMAAVVSPLFLLTKSRKHFLTIGFRDPNGRQQAIVLRVNKGKIRATLASLEARTGLRVQYQDDEARKAGKG